MKYILTFVGYVTGLVAIAYNVALAPIVNTVTGKPTKVGVVRTAIWVFAGLVTLFFPAASVLAALASMLTALDFMYVQVYFAICAVPFTAVAIGGCFLVAKCS